MKAKDLRNSVLQLAIQGKLVEQNPEDEPASALLERIQAEKKQLIKEGKLKKQKVLPLIAEDEIPFDIPDSWEWVRFGEILFTLTGLSYKKDNLSFKTDNMVRILRGGNIDDLSLSFKPNDIFIDISYVKPDTLLKQNDLITPAVSSLDHIGKIALSSTNYNNVAVGGFVLILKQYLNNDVASKYLLYCLSSKYHRDNCRNITNKSGQAFYNLSRAKLVELLLPIPPLAEQQRIVEKLEQIMPLIDEYEKLETELTKLEDDFPDKLKKSILQYAVQGKLVEQNKEDEPASVLIEKIKKEKEQLIKEGKIKKQKALPPISEDEIPFDIPDSWEWVRLGEIIKSTQNGISKRKGTTGKHTNVLRLADVSNSKVNTENFRSIILNDNEIIKYKLKQNDILITRVNGSIDIVGNFTLFNIIEDCFAYCDHFIRMRTFNKHILPSYVFLLGQTDLVRNQIKKAFITTAGQKTINQTHLSNLVVSIPSLNEQQRIVDKVEELFALVDIISSKDALKAYKTKPSSKNVIEVKFKTQAKTNDNIKAAARGNINKSDLEIAKEIFEEL